MPEYYEKRMRAGKPKAEQIKRTGEKIVAAACENCKLQLGDLNNYYNLGVEVKGLVDLVANAKLSESVQSNDDDRISPAQRNKCHFESFNLNTN